VGSNTTLVGVGKHAVIRGAWLDLRGEEDVPGSRSNIIIRNITFQDTYDCFPEWDPTDGDEGSWNALYDVISLRATDHVWIDHSTFENPRTPDDERPIYFGQVDITNGSDFVTVSWNRFMEHNKSMLIGSSDSRTTDRDKLNVTLHHNLFKNNAQRVPRVRFGKVHIYNNLYWHIHNGEYSYSWGVGIESAIYAENNVFKIVGEIPPAEFIEEFNGTDIFEAGTLVFSHDGRRFVDVLAEYNAANEDQLGSDVGWEPNLYTHIEPSERVRRSVLRGSGPSNWKGGHSD
jgi:pectate lyase